jgi:hypothetical protein
VSRAYLRLDPGFDERKHAYPDGAYAALVATFCLAEQQPQRGRFRSLPFLKALLGRRGRHVRYLLDQGDLVELPDGRVYVDGWDEWQEGDWKVGERVQRIRNRRRGVTPTTVTPVTPPTVYTPSPLRESTHRDTSGGAGGAKRSRASGRYAGHEGAVAPGSNGAEAMSPSRAHAILDDPSSSDEARAGARSYLELRERWGGSSSLRVDEPPARVVAKR